MNTVIWAFLVAAQATAQGGGQPPAGGGAPSGGGDPSPPGMCGAGGFQPLIVMGLMFAVFYFLLIRPQQKRAKEHANMLNQLQKGDTVITRGGILGKVTGVQDNVVILELQEKVRVRVLKSYIDGKQPEPGKTAAKSEPNGKSDEKKADKADKGEQPSDTK